MQADLGGETSSKARQGMESIGREAKDEMQFARNGLDDLTNAMHEAPPPRGGLSYLRAAVRLGQNRRVIVVEPMQL
ncbi:MAG TPA: hypothetical protein VKP04_02475 [Ktedonobacteraceae bacterium]|nr:hypothetical protein [Ktedonobacteraceae bacterium]